MSFRFAIPVPDKVPWENRMMCSVMEVLSW